MNKQKLPSLVHRQAQSDTSPPPAQACSIPCRSLTLTVASPISCSPSLS